MSTGFGAQPGELEAAATRFDESARVITDALAALRSALAGLGDDIGSDEQGRRFGAEYHPKEAQGLSALAAEADAVRSLGGALRSTAGEYRSSDAAGAAPFGPAGG